MKRVECWHSLEEVEAAKTEHVIKTVEEYGDLILSIRNDAAGWFDEFISLCKYYYEGHPGGGIMHIVLDDGNLGDDDIAWCAGYALGVSDHQASDIACLMGIMTMEQRKRVYEAL